MPSSLTAPSSGGYPTPARCTRLRCRQELSNMMYLWRDGCDQGCRCAGDGPGLRRYATIRRLVALAASTYHGPTGRAPRHPRVPAGGDVVHAMGGGPRCTQPLGRRASGQSLVARPERATPARWMRVGGSRWWHGRGDVVGDDRALDLHRGSDSAVLGIARTTRASSPPTWITAISLSRRAWWSGSFSTLSCCASCMPSHLWRLRGWHSDGWRPRPDARRSPARDGGGVSLAGTGSSGPLSAAGRAQGVRPRRARSRSDARLRRDRAPLAAA